MLTSGIAVPQFKAPQGLPSWWTIVPPTGIVVGVVGLHDTVPHACCGRGHGRTGYPSHGRFACPDRNDGQCRPDTICDACRRTGHVVANCDVLAIALFIKKYKRDLSDDVKDKIEMDWVACWRSAIGNPTKKPRRVMKTYLDLLDITVDDLDNQMCWDCWPEGNDVNDVAADTPSE